MPSPFPGMDPFLEHPLHFGGLHDRLITNISNALQPILPPPYYAEIGERLWVEVAERLIEPDVHVVRSGEERVELPSSGAVAVASGVTLPVVITVPHVERRETFVEIRRRLEGEDRVVTSIEVLSMSNKTPGEHGRDLYLQKQNELMESKTHLVEIDLLRAGVHTTAVDRAWMLAKTGPCDYHVCVHRFDRSNDFFVYPIQMTDRLPQVGIPLLPGDGEVALDLQQVFSLCYDLGPYRRKVRYRLEEIVPPLSESRRAWADELLKSFQP
jgi:hypothetical protein